jgi:arylsulfatase A-like enzyme
LRDVHARWARVLLGGGNTLPLGRLLAYAVLFGLAGGVLEASYLTSRQMMSGLLATGYRIELFWMAPLAGAVTMSLIAAAMHGAARLGAAHVSLTKSTGVFAFVALHGVFQSPGIPLHPLAELVWSLGLASVAAKAVDGHPARVRFLLRHPMAPVGGAAAILFGLAVVWSPAWAERRAHRDLPPAEAGLPNIVLIILDTVRAANLSLYGYERNTSPYLEEWAADGVTFERAYTTAPWTLPAHASLFTGLYPFESRTDIDEPLGPTPPTLAEVLSARGYATAGFVANLLYTTRTSGLDRGFAHYRAHPWSAAQIVRSYWLPRELENAVRSMLGRAEPTKDGSVVTHEFFQWLERRDGRPFFAFLNYFDAHDPYEPPEPYLTMFGPGPPEPWGEHVDWLGARADSASLLLLDQWVQRYDGGIAYVDRQLGLVRERLRAEGLLDNTVVVIASDHGEAWSEHGLIGHLNALYVPLLHVPLVVAYPGRLPRGIAVSEPVTLRDVPATILDLALPQDEPVVPGSSLTAPLLGTGSASESAVLAEVRTYQGARPKAALFQGDFHYMHTLDGPEELYNLAEDPDEGRSVAGAPEQALRIDGFRDVLLELGVVPRR